MKNRIIVIGSIILLVAIVLAGIIIFKFMDKSSELESLVVFGENVEVEKDKHFYYLHMKSATVKSVGGGCELPFIIGIKNVKGQSGTLFTVAGEKYAYYFFNIEGSREDDFNEEEDNNYDLSSFDYGIYVILDEPLVVEGNC